LNTIFLHQHYKDINHDHHFQMFHILFFIETRIQHASTDVHKFINSSYISIHDGHGLMIMYDIHMQLDSFNTIINDGLLYRATTFNINTQKVIHIVCVYRSHSCSISTFLNNQIIIQRSPKHCPIIIMGNFYVEILKDNNQPKKTRIIIFHV